ncbi:sulfotransferase ssu-1-like [Amblyomma americanum]
MKWFVCRSGKPDLLPVLRDGLPPPSGLELQRSQPSLELFGVEDAENIARPGLTRTHFNYDLAPKSPKAKYMWVCRNPKDVCVSFFYHKKARTAYDFTEGKFEDYFEIFLQGANDFGDYFDYELSGRAHRNDLNVVLLNYEDIRVDPRSLVLRLAAFLGEEYHRRLVQEPEIPNRVLERSTIDYMKGKTAGIINTFFDKPPVNNQNLCPGINHYMETLMKTLGMRTSFGKVS